MSYDRIIERARRAATDKFVIDPQAFRDMRNLPPASGTSISLLPWWRQWLALIRLWRMWWR